MKREDKQLRAARQELAKAVAAEKNGGGSDLRTYAARQAVRRLTGGVNEKTGRRP